ncbi:MAG: THUMP domain-containing protein [Nanoarchaeota archaeon]
MKGLSIVSKGIEDISALEINELIKVDTVVEERAVIFDVKTYEDLCLLCYKSQSSDRIILLLDSFKFKKIKDIQKKVKSIDLSQWLDKNKTFRVTSSISDNELSSAEIDPEVGSFIFDNIKKNNKIELKVNLDNPDVIFFVYVVKDKCYFGVDFSGFDMHKRSYKVFHNRASLRGTIAYALVRLAGFNGKEKLLDCFMGDGTTVIEAALFGADSPVRYFDKDQFVFSKFIDFDFDSADKKTHMDNLDLAGCDPIWLNVNNAKKNAKIANINKLISFSKMDIDFLETKFPEGSVDLIVTQVPVFGKHSNVKEIEKIYDEFFYQAEFILNKKGRLVVISNKDELLKEIAVKYKFNVVDQRDVWSGEAKLKILVFVK